MFDLTRALRLMLFCLFSLIVTPAAMAQTTLPVGVDPVVAVQDFRVRMEKIMADFQIIASVSKNSEVLAKAQTGQQYIQSVTEADWNGLVLALRNDPTAVIPEITGLSDAVSAAATAVQASSLASAQVDPTPREPFPEFGPGYPACPAEWEQPGFQLGMSTAALILGAVMSSLTFVCAIGIFFTNFAFVCIAPSIALGILSAFMSFMGTCRILNGRLSTPTNYDALVYVDNILRLNSTELQALILSNSIDSIRLTKTAETEIITASDILRDSIIAEIRAAIQAQQFNLLEDINSNLASVENSVNTTTTNSIALMKTEVINYAKAKGDLVIANTNSRTAEILAGIDVNTKAIIANLEADSNKALQIVAQMGCESLRLKAQGGSSNLSICSSPASLAPVNSSSGSGQQPPVANSTGPAPVSGGCSAAKSESIGDLPMLMGLLFSIFGLRAFRSRKAPWSLNKVLLSSIAIGSFSFLFAAPQANAQNIPTVESFRAQYEEGVANIGEYLQAMGKTGEAQKTQEGLAAMAQLSNSDLETFFADVPPDATGNSIPDLSALAEVSRNLLTQLNPTNAQASLLTPPEGFPPMGADFCPFRFSNDAIYALTVVDAVFVILMSIITFPCYQEAAGVTFLVFICIALSIVAAAVNVALNTAINCAFVEGGPPTFEALNFIAFDIENQFALLQNKENEATFNVQQQIIDTQNAIMTNDFESYIAVTTNANADILQELNYIKSDASTSFASIENSIINTTSARLTAAKNEIKANTDTVTASIIANANTQAAAILAKANLDAKKIIANVKADAQKIINLVLELGCQNIDLASGKTQNTANPACVGLPGF